MSRSEIVTAVVFTGFFLCSSLTSNPLVPSPWKQPLVAHLVYPILILLLLRRNPFHDGLGIGNWRTGLWLALLASIVVVVSNLLFAKVPEMASYYTPARWGTGDPGVILLAEGKRFSHLAGWEFLFRGFLLFPLRSTIGPAANLIQATLCAVMHAGKPLVEFYGSFPFALLLGYLARKANSIWYGVFVHWVLGFSLELFLTLGKKGILPFF